jgi:hypothetical protein
LRVYGLGSQWTWGALPAMGVGRQRSSACVMSNGRFAVLGGSVSNNKSASSCEALTVGDNKNWGALPLMIDSRDGCAYMAVAGCVIVSKLH